MRLRFLTADVFTDTPFSGNPLAVLPEATGLTDVQMQRIAREFNFSETVFVLPATNPNHAARLRIFTPTSELPFAGHPTIGTSLALVEIGAVRLVDGSAEIILEENVGPIPVRISTGGHASPQAWLTARAPSAVAESPDLNAIAELISLKVSDIATGHDAPECVSNGSPFLLVPLVNIEALSRATPDVNAFRRILGGYATEKVFLFAYDAVTRSARARMFAPLSGIIEDPATGSAASCLAAYLARRASAGPFEWRVDQGVEMGRPSVMNISAHVTNGEVSSVSVGGGAVFITEGSIRIPS